MEFLVRTAKFVITATFQIADFNVNAPISRLQRTKFHTKTTSMDEI
jgi:hypothetical protein